MERVQLKKPQLSRAEFTRRADDYLKKAQAELLPEQAAKIIAINMDTGEYVFGSSKSEALAAFEARWPDCLFFMCRVDGGAATKYHGYVPL